jgi:hypothetical protein
MEREGDNVGEVRRRWGSIVMLMDDDLSPGMKPQEELAGYQSRTFNAGLVATTPSTYAHTLPSPRSSRICI